MFTEKGNKFLADTYIGNLISYHKIILIFMSSENHCLEVPYNTQTQSIQSYKTLTYKTYTALISCSHLIHGHFQE